MCVCYFISNFYEFIFLNKSYSMCCKSNSSRLLNSVVSCDTPIRICTKYYWYQDYNDFPCPQYQQNSTYPRLYVAGL